MAKGVGLGLFAKITSTIVKKKALEDIAKQVSRKEFMLQIGERIRDLIVARTRTGKGVTDDQIEKPNEIQLKQLSQPYVEFRRRYKGFKGRFFRTSNSNLTLTGQMLDAVDLEAREGFVKVFVRNTRRKGEELTNEQVAGFVRRDRPFMALSVNQDKVIRREIDRETRAIVRRYFAK